MSHDFNSARLSRRAFVAGLPLFLAACQTAGTSTPTTSLVTPVDPNNSGRTRVVNGYEAITTEPWPIAAIDTSKIDPRFLRQEVSNPTREKPGTIVVDTQNKFLYLVEDGGRARRYGVGVGRDGFAWNGRAIIDRKQEWPKWHPPKEMMARDPEAAKWPNGMPGGITNPLGPRALYLAQNGKDTYYRIHGTTQPHSIGKAMSSGCIRLFNQDIIDLYNRVPIGSEVVVMQAGIA
ncbi:L,D-transpeptidase family protein [Terrihabitans sp. B22-R8]|uniref:L,D-transpeptidase family protein n=1 Tax=Terrihabitans sp. B22-R8 TaxID=3425128 RepID=UPI00403C536D